ncbi:hypothetical protein K2Y00_04120 [Patescibacteria group bacterium]|nr:hypothetical protein [Patescibacteria group bacterium]
MTIATLSSLLTSGEFESPRMTEIASMVAQYNLPGDAEVPQDIKGLLLEEAAVYEELAADLDLKVAALTALEETATNNLKEIASVVE